MITSGIVKVKMSHLRKKIYRIIFLRENKHQAISFQAHTHTNIIARLTQEDIFERMSFSLCTCLQIRPERWGETSNFFLVPHPTKQ